MPLDPLDRARPEREPVAPLDEVERSAAAVAPETVVRAVVLVAGLIGDGPARLRVIMPREGARRPKLAASAVSRLDSEEVEHPRNVDHFRFLPFLEPDPSTQVSISLAARVGPLGGS